MSLSSRLVTLTDRAPALCVGLDPHPSILLRWGFGDDAQGLKGWSERVCDLVLAGNLSIVKPQVAFFERHGVAGLSALASLLGTVRQAGVLVIGDAKRGDIGTTMEAYADVWLVPGADFEVDALTVVAYQGVGAITPALDRALSFDKGAFVLAATSNPEATDTQRALRADGLSVAAGVVQELDAWVSAQSAPAEAFGVVVGATVDQSLAGIDLGAYPRMPILAPGYGAQGASLSTISEHFPASRHVIPVAARSILESGPDGFSLAVDAARSEIGAR
jgi:orotidine-5'-phosphate decarboxylase